MAATKEAEGDRFENEKDELERRFNERVDTLKLELEDDIAVHRARMDTAMATAAARVQAAKREYNEEVSSANDAHRAATMQNESFCQGVLSNVRAQRRRRLN